MKIVANLDLGTNTKAVNVIDDGGSSSGQDLITKNRIDAEMVNFKITPTITVLTSGTNATYTLPANVTAIKVIAIGGGGGGGGARSTATSGYAASSGGGAGQAIIMWYQLSRSSSTRNYTYTIGQGGGGGSSSGGNGATGTPTIFVVSSKYLYAAPGTGGTGISTGTAATGVSTAGSGGNQSKTDYTALGAPYSDNEICNEGSVINFCLSIPGGSGNHPTVYTAVTTLSDFAAGGGGGKSFLGSLGEFPSVYRGDTDTAAYSASASAFLYGSGGNGAAAQGVASTAGTAGTNGIIIIEEYYSYR